MNRKAELPLVKTLLILFVSTIILVSFILILANKNISVNDSKFKTQLIYDKILSNNCLFSNYDVIDLNKFTDDNLNKCFGNNQENKFTLRLDLYLKNKYFKTIYYNKPIFTQLSSLCNVQSNLFCNEMIYPILYKKNGVYENAKLIIWSVVR